ncbi:MAG: alcohol dehydrogenase catalytic domain-containing protein [Dehalococcoidia bacterium]|jgi:threonine dehydrogenase-like Zn-dependent dehydrogenase
MKAAIYYGPGDIRVEEIPTPHAGPLGAVVKIEAAGVCEIMDGAAWQKRGFKPTEIGKARGHEWSGEIVELGSEVTGFNIGDRIYQNAVFKPCYTCEYCKLSDYWRCINWRDGLIQRGIHGAMAEYLWIPFLTTETAAILPKSLSFRDLAMVEPVGLGTGVARKARVDDVTLVVGQDLVGLSAVIKLKEMGVKKVIAVDYAEIRLQASKECGADVVINSLKDDPVRIVMEETKGNGADVTILADKRPVSLLHAIGSTCCAGIIWTTTYYYHPLVIDPAVKAGESFWIGPGTGYESPPINFDPKLLTIHTAWGTLGPRVQRWLEAAEYMEAGKITAEKYVTHAYPLEKTREAFDMTVNPHESIKVLIEL